MQNNKKIITLLGSGFFLLSPFCLQALCLKDCQTSAPSHLTPFTQIESRQQSHNFGDQSTNVLGDVNVRVGHEHIEIKGMENSTNSVIDASVHSTVILGNLKQ